MALIPTYVLASNPGYDLVSNLGYSLDMASTAGMVRHGQYGLIVH